MVRCGAVRQSPCDILLATSRWISWSIQVGFSARSIIVIILAADRHIPKPILQTLRLGFGGQNLGHIAIDNFHRETCLHGLCFNEIAARHKFQLLLKTGVYATRVITSGRTKRLPDPFRKKVSFVGLGPALMLACRYCSKRR